MSETKCPGCKERDERIVELEAELARPKHEVLRQLADAIERIKELEAQRERTATETDALRRAVNGVVPEDSRRFEDLDLCVALNNYHDRVEWLPIVRAAMEQEERHSDAARHYPHDPRDLCACSVCVQVRALTPEQRARLEEI